MYRVAFSKPTRMRGCAADAALECVAGDILLIQGLATEVIG